jgi:hypothetical protein
MEGAAYVARSTIKPGQEDQLGTNNQRKCSVLYSTAKNLCLASSVPDP